MCLCGPFFFVDRMQAHFKNIQRIADTTTLPHAMHFLSSRIEEELELSQLTDRLMQGRGQPNTLTSSEKLDLWDRLKFLSMCLHSSFFFFSNFVVLIFNSLTYELGIVSFSRLHKNSIVIVDDDIT